MLSNDQADLWTYYYSAASKLGTQKDLARIFDQAKRTLKDPLDFVNTVTAMI